jgi:hypothetical protein
MIRKELICDKCQATVDRLVYLKVHLRDAETDALLETKDIRRELCPSCAVAVRETAEREATTPGAVARADG